MACSSASLDSALSITSKPNPATSEGALQASRPFVRGAPPGEASRGRDRRLVVIVRAERVLGVLGCDAVLAELGAEHARAPFAGAGARDVGGRPGSVIDITQLGQAGDGCVGGGGLEPVAEAVTEVGGGAWPLRDEREAPLHGL